MSAQEHGLPFTEADVATVTVMSILLIIETNAKPTWVQP
jgi:hypothetical protein